MMRWMIVAGMALVGCAQAVDEPQNLPKIKVLMSGAELKVQVADDVDERAKGLMFVKSMAPNAGMLFVWSKPEPRSFWMRNTYIPLDLIYLNDGKVVSLIEKAKPFDETGLPSGVPADMVLEVNAGWVARHGVKVGDRLQVK